MPGRLVLTHTVEKIFDSYDVKMSTEEWIKSAEKNSKIVTTHLTVPRYNITPGQKLICVTGEKDHRDARFMKWGLVPFWAKDINVGFKMKNARSETIATKRSFRNAFRSRRCLIPITGFYEWKADSKGKKKAYYFKKTDDSLITFAGIWESRAYGDGNQLITCSIVTTEPNKVVSEIHDRMGLVLTDESKEIWLNPDSKREELEEIMIPYEPDDIEYFEVSTLCSSPTNDSPECIERIAPGNLLL